MRKILIVAICLVAMIALVGCGNKKIENETNIDNNIEIDNSNIVGDDVNMQNEVMYVSMDDIEQIMQQKENYIIVDVRTIEEYNEGHIPNSICVPNETIIEDPINELPDKNQLLLVYCRSGNRSKDASEKLHNLGYTNIIEFGGIIDWKGEIEK